MANPNIVNVTEMRGETTALTLTTSPQAIVNNPADSGKALKINALYVANANGALDADVVVNLYPEDDLGGTPKAIVHLTPVPAGKTLIAIDKDTAIYLKEDRSIGAFASEDGDIDVICSYEEIA